MSVFGPNYLLFGYVTMRCFPKIPAGAEGSVGLCKPAPAPVKAEGEIALICW